MPRTGPGRADDERGGSVRVEPGATEREPEAVDVHGELVRQRPEAASNIAEPRLHRVVAAQAGVNDGASELDLAKEDAERV